MKRSIFAFLVLLGAMVISIASPLIYNHYVNETQSLTGDATYSAVTEEITAQVTNPVFSTSEDAVQFHERECLQWETDSVFNSMPPEAVKTIATVLIGRKGFADKQSIADEFKTNYKDTYQFVTVVEKQSGPPNVGKSDTIKGPHSVTQDTIINGKRFQLIKETENNG